VEIESNSEMHEGRPIQIISAVSLAEEDSKAQSPPKQVSFYSRNEKFLYFETGGKHIN